MMPDEDMSVSRKKTDGPSDTIEFSSKLAVILLFVLVFVVFVIVAALCSLMSFDMAPSGYLILVIALVIVTAVCIGLGFWRALADAPGERFGVSLLSAIRLISSLAVVAVTLLAMLVGISVSTSGRRDQRPQPVPAQEKSAAPGPSRMDTIGECGKLGQGPPKTREGVIHATESKSDAKRRPDAQNDEPTKKAEENPAGSDSDDGGEEGSGKTEAAKHTPAVKQTQGRTKPKRPDKRRTTRVRTPRKTTRTERSGRPAVEGCAGCELPNGACVAASSTSIKGFPCLACLPSRRIEVRQGWCLIDGRCVRAPRGRTGRAGQTCQPDANPREWTTRSEFGGVRKMKLDGGALLDQPPPPIGEGDTQSELRMPGLVGGDET